MTTEKMTVHKALSELKTLNDRINKVVNGTEFVFANKHSNNILKGMTIQSHCAQIKSAYQSANDLMARKSAIKRSVMMSNAMAKVTIGGVEYTVAEAIEVKNHAIPMWKSLLKKMVEDSENAKRAAALGNGTNLENRADAYVKSLYENADMKNASEEVKKVRADFIAAQTMELVDPINIFDEMKKLEDKINAFTTEVDSALSVSNALTEIEISY